MPQYAVPLPFRCAVARPRSGLIPPFVSGAAFATCVLAFVWRAQQAHDAARSYTDGCQLGRQPYYFDDGGSAKFNETPQPHDWRLLSLDPACQPRQLVAPMINASRRAVPRAAPLALMFFGDRCVGHCLLEVFELGACLSSSLAQARRICCSPVIIAAAPCRPGRPPARALAVTQQCCYQDARVDQSCSPPAGTPPPPFPFGGCEASPVLQRFLSASEPRARPTVSQLILPAAGAPRA